MYELLMGAQVSSNRSPFLALLVPVFFLALRFVPLLFESPRMPFLASGIAASYCFIHSMASRVVQRCDPCLAGLR